VFWPEFSVTRPFLLLAAGALLASPVQPQSRGTVVVRGKVQQLQLYKGVTGTPVILSSGDLGWAGLVVHVAEFLSSRGYSVYGFNSKAYLASFTSRDSALKPEEVPDDYLSLIRFVQRINPGKVVLAGISEGAGLSVLSAGWGKVQESVQGVLGLGLPDQNELGWRWQDFTTWITKRAPNEPSFMVEDIIHKVSPVPLAEIHSTHDEFLPLEQAKSMFARAREPKKMWVIEASNHRFSDNRSELDARILEALDWIMRAR